MYCPNCGKEIPNGIKFCGYCGANISKELADYNNAKADIQNVQNSSPNSTMQFGNFENVYSRSNEKSPNGKKRGKGIIAAIVAVILVLAIGGSAAAYHFINADKSKKSDTDDALLEASTKEEDSSLTATSSEDEEKISGEEALEAACKKLAKAKDYNTEFRYEFEIGVEGVDEDLYGTISEVGEFDVVTDFDVNTDDPDANILEVAKGTVTRDIFGEKKSEDIIVSRGDYSGNFVTSIEYESGDKYATSENRTVDEVLGFTDYDLYSAKLLDETEVVDGTECYVYVSENTYEQGGIGSVFTPVTGIYNGESDLCSVTIYVSVKDAELVKIYTDFTDPDDDPLAQSVNKYCSTEDVEFSINKLTYSIVFTEFDSGVDIDPDFDDLLAESSNYNKSFTLYLNAIKEACNPDFTDNDEEVADDDTTYVLDSYGALTYEVPKDWYGDEIDIDDYTGNVYFPSNGDDAVILVMYEDFDMSSLSETEKKQAIDLIVVTMCKEYNLSTDNIKKGTVNGGYAENTRGSITEDGDTMEMDIMVFETGGTGVGIVIFAANDIENSGYLPQYYHLLETLEF